MESLLTLQDSGSQNNPCLPTTAFGPQLPPLVIGVAGKRAQAPPFQITLWLSVRPFGNVRGDPFQNEFPDQIRHSIRTHAGQTIEDD